MLYLLAQIDSGQIFVYVLLIVVVVAFIGFQIKSQKARAAQAEAMHKALKIGDSIRTVGGVLGKITEINETEKTITISSGTSTIVFDREAVYPLSYFNKPKVDIDSLVDEVENSNENDLETEEQPTSDDSDQM